MKAKRLKSGVEPIWFEIMPCGSFYSVLRIGKVPKNENILCIIVFGVMVRSSTHAAWGHEHELDTAYRVHV